MEGGGKREVSGEGRGHKAANRFVFLAFIPFNNEGSNCQIPESLGNPSSLLIELACRLQKPALERDGCDECARRGGEGRVCRACYCVRKGARRLWPARLLLRFAAVTEGLAAAAPGGARLPTWRGRCGFCCFIFAGHAVARLRFYDAHLKGP
jgi:hypothetical protein